MSYMKGVVSGAAGNTRLLKDYGAGSKGPRQSYATGGAVKGYATGGLVDAGGNADMGTTDGKAAKPNLARPGRKMAGKPKDAGKKGTNVNVVIMQKPDGDAKPPMPMAGPPPGPPPPMPMPPPGPGGPPMPMRASGGRVKKADGGGLGDATVKIEDVIKAPESASESGSASKAKVEPEVSAGPYKFGGKVKLDAGAGGAKGRMEKIKSYGDIGVKK